jgi:hypothetical protein
MPFRPSKFLASVLKLKLTNSRAAEGLEFSALGEVVSILGGTSAALRISGLIAVTSGLLGLKMKSQAKMPNPTTRGAMIRSVPVMVNCHLRGFADDSTVASTVSAARARSLFDADPVGSSRRSLCPSLKIHQMRATPTRALASGNQPGGSIRNVHIFPAESARPCQSSAHLMNRQAGCKKPSAPSTLSHLALSQVHMPLPPRQIVLSVHRLCMPRGLPVAFAP